MTIQTSGHQDLHISAVDGWVLRCRNFDPTTPYAAVWGSTSGAEGTATTYAGAREHAATNPNGLIWFPTAGEAAEALDAGTREDYLRTVLS